MAGLSTRRFFDIDAVRQFDAIFELNKLDARIRPGASAEVTIIVDPVKTRSLPATPGTLRKEGKPVVYVKMGHKFEPREVKIARRTEAHIVVDGLSEGTEVALVNPEEEATKPARTNDTIAMPR